MAPEREVAELPVRLGWFGGGKMLVVWEWWQGVRLLYCLKL